MSTEATSSLTFSDLITEVAFKLGVAKYGTDGTGAYAIPTDVHDLALCKKIVNKAIRMFVNDGPSPNGWRWTKPIAQVDLWSTVSTSSANLITVASFSGGTGLTTITVAQTPSFYPSMELRTITLGGTDFTIVSYLSPTQITVKGDAHLKVGGTWSITSTGDYTLSANFGGEYSGEITYIANTNRGMTLHWTDEATIRFRRQNHNIESGTPYMAAVRVMPTPSLPPDYTAPRRRWELITWRMTNEVLHVLFPYVLAFDELVNLTDFTPAPFTHDETIKAACLAVAEKEIEDTTGGPDWNYYRNIALPNSFRIDAMAAPKMLGYFGSGNRGRGVGPAINAFRDYFYQRPTVPFS